jgi:hypothetical protein
MPDDSIPNPAKRNVTQMQKTCDNCAIQYQPRSNRQRFCVVCGPVKRAERSAIYTIGTGTCLHCGGETRFRAESHRMTRKFCSRSCLAKWRERQGHIADIRTVGLDPRGCISCGDEYVPVSARQLHCKMCIPTKNDLSRYRRYGVTAPDVAVMFARQDGRCAICGSVNPACVDHDHDTGFVRGLLCRTCNMVLAYFENTAWQAKMEEYLNAVQVS